MITHGPLGILWTGLGLGAFYIALVWINGLLGHFLTPMFILTASRFISPEKEEPASPAQ